MVTRADKIWEKLNEYGEITSLEIIDMTNTTCPHDIIRQLRKRYGYDSITDSWVLKTKRVVDDKGKIQLITRRFKRYFLNKLGAIA